MTLFDVMRGFFGLPARNDCPEANPGFKNPIMNGDDEDDDDLFSDIYRHNRKDQFGFNIFAGDILEMQRFFEQQFDEILKSFQSNWFSNSFQDPNVTPGGNDNTDDRVQHYRGDSPRDKFLKPSYVNPPKDSHTSIEDTDIDNKVNPSSILDLFPDKNNEKKNEPILPYSSKIHRTFTSQSIQKRMLPNGGIEEERKCIRNGQEEIRVSRQLGNMKHVVTSIRLPDGTTEKCEEYINMDEGQLSDFNKAWSSSMASRPRNFNTDEPEFPTSNLFEIFRNFL